MEADFSHRLFILRREYLFQGLEPAQLARVASLLEDTRVPQGELIFSQGDPPDKFYIILEGKVRIVRKERRGERYLNVLGPGDFFGEQALLFNDPRMASAYAETDVLLASLTQEKFWALLEEYPQIRLNLAATAHSRKLVHRINFSWQDKEEVIYYISHTHPIFVVLALFWPVLIAFSSLVVWVFLGMANAALVLGVPLIVALAWGLWVYVDWSNDYYIVTNQRVVWQEKVVMLYDSRQEAPLNTVVSVNTTTSLLGRILDYGNVDVRTFTGSMLLKKVYHPYLFVSFVEGYRKRFQAISKEKEEQEIENALHTALLKSISPPEVQAPAGEAPKQSVVTAYKAPPPKKQPTVMDDLKRAMQTFLKVRYEEGKTITYRKHYLVLLRMAGLPLLITLAVFWGLIWAIFAKQVLVVALLLVLFLVALVWLVYQFLDWSNDIYRLTPEQIMDIEKKPLGKEQKTTSSLDAPDFRVEHIRKNLIHILFNYGDVVVSIGQTKFTFDGVYNPDQVHQDVANYRAALQRKKQEDESKRDRERMVNWLVAYHKQAEILEKPEKPAES